jgi:DNA-binding MarR family transcriptional regulator
MALETRGWITRRPDPADARYTLATLTDEGARKVADCTPGYYATLREHLFDRLSPDQVRELGSITAQIV